MQFASWISLSAFFIRAFLFFAVWSGVVWQRVPSLSEFGLAAFCGLFFTGAFTVYRLLLSFSRQLFGGHEDAANQFTRANRRRRLRFPSRAGGNNYSGSFII
jgi:hypothetical protein